MKWIIRGYALVLLAYTGWRTWDFMRNQLPEGETGAVLALLFLFATEAGLVLWHEISLRHTTTQEQHYVAVTLTWVDFVGSLAAGIADMILRQNFAEGYTIPPILITFLIYGLPAIVALNVAGVLFYLSNDSELQLARAQRELRYEIHRQAIKELNENKTGIAEGMKKDLYRQLRDEVTGKVYKEFIKTPQATSTPAPLPVMSIHGSGNGKVSYNAETEAVEVKNGGKGARD